MYKFEVVGVGVDIEGDLYLQREQGKEGRASRIE
jgi:hypothetical protein